MLRKMMIALLAAVSVSLVSPDVASARGFGGGGFHGGGGGFHGGFGGFHGGGGGFHGGGFHGGGFHGGFWPGFAVGAGLGLYAPYYYGYDPYYEYPYYYGEEEEDGECYLVRRHIHTRHGWRWSTVQVCQ